MKFATFTRRALASAGIALLAAAGTVSAANAHDTLTGSSPENGATVESSPEEITLTFSAQLQENPVPDAKLAALTLDGETVEAEATLDGDTVVLVPADELDNGDYTVAYRVVSSDGHPVDGTIAFTVDAPQEEASAAPSESATMQPSEPATAEPTDAAQPTDDAADTAPEDASGLSPVVWIVLGVVVLGAVIAVLVNFTRKNK